LGDVRDINPDQKTQGRKTRLPRRARHLPALVRRKFTPLTDVKAAFAAGFAERRLFVALPFCMIAGLIAYKILPHEPHPLALMIVALGLVSALPFMQAIGPLRALVSALGFWVGFCLLAIHGALFGTPMLSYPAYGSYIMRVDQVLSEDDTARRIIVSSITPLGDAPVLPIRRARLFVRDADGLAAGDQVRGPVRFAPVPGPVVPGGFDSQFHGYFDGIGAFGNTTGHLSVITPGQSGPRRFIDGVRKAIGLRIDAVLAPPANAIARALTIGDQTLITDETRKTMATAGLAHVLAISGLHLTLVAGGVFAAIRVVLALSLGLGQRLAVKKMAALGGMAAALVYLSLSGGSVSAVRATIMLMLVFGAVLAGRRALTMRNVAIAALFIIVTDPASVFRPSFQLSFAAVAALVGVYEMLRNRPPAASGFFTGLIRFFGGLALTSTIAGAATLLFAAYHFQQTAPLGVLGNLVALPLVGFVVLPAAFFAVLAMPFGVEWIFLKLMGWGIERILEIAAVVAGWSEGLSGSPLLTPLALVLGLAALGWFAFLPNRLRFAGPLAAVALIGLFGLDRPPDILVADSTQALAVRTDAGMGLMAGRTGSFAVNAWSETYQTEIAAKLEGASCDKVGCIFISPSGFKLALVKHPDAFAEDCVWADLVITRLTAPGNCRAAAEVIDRHDLRHGGVHWFSWEPDKAHFIVRPAIADPDRPWRAR